MQAHFPKAIDLTAVLDWWYWGALLGALLGIAGSWVAYREKPPLPGSPEDVAAHLPAKQKARRWVKQELAGRARRSSTRSSSPRARSC